MVYLLVREKSLILRTKLQRYTGADFCNGQMFSIIAGRCEDPGVWSCLWQSEIESDVFSTGGVSYQQLHFWKKLIPLKIA